MRTKNIICGNAAAAETAEHRLHLRSFAADLRRWRDGSAEGDRLHALDRRAEEALAKP